jgi:hypothetical protein
LGAALQGSQRYRGGVYRAGVKLIEERTGERHDCTRKQGVLHDETALPKNAPSLAMNRAELWNRMDHIEDRSTRPELYAVCIPTVKLDSLAVNMA